MLKCDGNQVVVGSCSSGRHGDCPGGAGHQMLCCDLPEYYYSACDTFSGGWGVQMDCRYRVDMKLDVVHLMKYALASGTLKSHPKTYQVDHIC